MKIEDLNKITEKIIGCGIEVHKKLGPGLLESVYQQCLAYELKLNNIAFETEVQIPVYYKGMFMDQGFRADFVVEQEIIVEIKAVEYVLPIHEAQVLTYLKLTGKKLGLILNYNVPLLKDGITRLISNEFKTDPKYNQMVVGT
jgi:GxxExxY protein